ncbi:MAG: hypothetical protein QOE57_586 [Acidimicrobiaceae bacterium]|nr:hypothetical protein [Acidimicrobiaceae bacterium]
MAPLPVSSPILLHLRLVQCRRVRARRWWAAPGWARLTVQARQGPRRSIRRLRRLVPWASVRPGGRWAPVLESVPLLDRLSPHAWHRVPLLWSPSGWALLPPPGARPARSPAARRAQRWVPLGWARQQALWARVRWARGAQLPALVGWVRVPLRRARSGWARGGQLPARVGWVRVPLRRARSGWARGGQLPALVGWVRVPLRRARPGWARGGQLPARLRWVRVPLRRVRVRWARGHVWSVPMRPRLARRRRWGPRRSALGELPRPGRVRLARTRLSCHCQTTPVGSRRRCRRRRRRSGRSPDDLGTPLRLPLPRWAAPARAAHSAARLPPPPPRPRPR